MAPSDKNQLEKLDFGTSVATYMQNAIPKSHSCHSSIVAGFVTKSSISNSALNISVITKGSDWIIDSGVYDCDPHKFIIFPLIVLKLLLLMLMGSHLLLKV